MGGRAHGDRGDGGADDATRQRRHPPVCRPRQDRRAIPLPGRVEPQPAAAGRSTPRSGRAGTAVGAFPDARGVALVASLLAVVVGHAMLAQGQVRLPPPKRSWPPSRPSTASLLAVAGAENPARIVAEAKKLNLVRPGR